MEKHRAALLLSKAEVRVLHDWYVQHTDRAVLDGYVPGGAHTARQQELRAVLSGWDCTTSNFGPGLSFHDVAEAQGFTATTGWSIEDVKRYWPELNDEQAGDYLDQHGERIVEAMCVAGNFYIETTPPD